MTERLLLVVLGVVVLLSLLSVFVSDSVGDAAWGLALFAFGATILAYQLERRRRSK